MNADKIVTAGFTPQNYTLTVDALGGDPFATFIMTVGWTPTALGGETKCQTPGSSNDAHCVVSFPAGTQLTLTGNWYGAGWFLQKAKWGGACSGESAEAKSSASAPPCTLTMDGNKAVILTHIN
jgi:hypothetical protein